MSRLLKEPLIHFLLGGALLFVLFAWKKGETEHALDEITIPASQVEVLLDSWARMWQRPPTPREAEKLIEDYVREEIYYREAIKLGLDQNDIIVRRRLRQKMEFLAEDIFLMDDPGDEQLRAFVHEHPDKFREPARLTWQHIYFSPDLRGDAASDDAHAVLADLASGTDEHDLAKLGDASFLPKTFDSTSEIDIARIMGADFVPKLLALPLHEWAGPLRSGFGYHVVRLTDRVDGRLPPLDAIRVDVLKEWQFAERKKFAETSYQQLRERYSVSVTMPEAPSGSAAGSRNGIATE